ncbi:MAG: ADP-ribosylglycohydrolase family protein [Actinobacteria bacterium]|nr:ADP-ribosylglycohydrolase family protein [Actinomycetota bacterium]
MSQKQRIAGMLLGMAAGDALGAGYEFSTPRPDTDIAMIGGGVGGFAPGEWTDDTSMAVCIADVTATGAVELDAIGERFLDWFRSGPADVGIQISAVLRGAASGADLDPRAADYHARKPDSSAGNGSLMRTAPVALAHLGDDDAIAEAARAASALTHADPLCQEACVLWCIAIDRAVREQRLDGVHDGLELLPEDRRSFWHERLVAAETQPPASFTPNGFVVTALQAAHAAISQTAIPDGPFACLHLQHALEAAVRIGHDTDTVAAIAGAVLGARWGASAIPFRWRRMLHGWPGYRAADLVRLAVLTARGGRPDGIGWPTAERLSTGGEPPYVTALPDDDGLLLGSLGGLDQLGELDEPVDVVVSLCRVGTQQVPADVEEHHEVWLIDEADHDSNPHLEFVLHDAVDAVAWYRAQGKRVFLHCHGGHSRTPTVAAGYLSEKLGLLATEALDRVAQVVPYYDHNRAFVGALANWSGSTRDG